MLFARPTLGEYCYTASRHVRPDTLAKLLADAGKAHLAPIGCRRIGRSRTWISDHGYWLIVVEFQPSGFAPIAANMAAQAASEVQRLRSRFRSLHDIYRYLIEHISEEDWHIFHPAIAAGLAEVEAARRLFQIYAEMGPRVGARWETELRARNAALATQLDEPGLFQTSVLAIIQECRLLNGLVPDEHCLDFLNPQQVMQR